MADVNEAYRILSDPDRRDRYDRSLRDLGESVGVWSTPDEADEDDPEISSTPVPPSRLMPSGPARVPWKMMLVAAVLGSAIIVGTSAFNDPPSVEPPDGIMRVGSCVAVESNNDVREVACANDGDDVVVELFLPTGATCPTGLGAYRDRLGLGTACIEMD